MNRGPVGPDDLPEAGGREAKGLGLAGWVLAVFFTAAGANHFRAPAIYLGMMPPWLPWPQAMNAISGAAEMLGGIGLMVPRTRRLAAWGLIVLLIAVFPANLHVALQGRMPGTDFSPLVLWGRLPFQVAFVAAVWWIALRKKPARLSLAP
ncbi:MAG: DoxX family protein [Opitutaceae bacterium]